MLRSSCSSVLFCPKTNLRSFSRTMTTMTMRMIEKTFHHMRHLLMRIFKKILSLKALYTANQTLNIPVFTPSCLVRLCCLQIILESSRPSDCVIHALLTVSKLPSLLGRGRVCNWLIVSSCGFCVPPKKTEIYIHQHQQVFVCCGNGSDSSGT